MRSITPITWPLAERLICQSWILFPLFKRGIGLRSLHSNSQTPCLHVQAGLLLGQTILLGYTWKLCWKTRNRSSCLLLWLMPAFVWVIGQNTSRILSWSSYRSLESPPTLLPNRSGPLCSWTLWVNLLRRWSQIVSNSKWSSMILFTQTKLVVCVSALLRMLGSSLLT